MGFTFVNSILSSLWQYDRQEHHKNHCRKGEQHHSDATQSHHCCACLTWTYFPSIPKSFLMSHRPISAHSSQDMESNGTSPTIAMTVRNWKRLSWFISVSPRSRWDVRKRGTLLGRVLHQILPYSGKRLVLSNTSEARNGCGGGPGGKGRGGGGGNQQEFPVWFGLHRRIIRYWLSLQIQPSPVGRLQFETPRDGCILRLALAWAWGWSTPAVPPYSYPSLVPCPPPLLPPLWCKM